MNRAIIIGATSGIGMELARLMSEDGIELGLTGRRAELLDKLKAELPTRVYTRAMDITETGASIKGLTDLIREMDGVDMILISAGTGHINSDLDWPLERETIDTNVTGVTALMAVAMKHFLGVGTGHLAALSSVAALRGDAACPAYNASKAYVSNYLEGLRCKARKSGLPIAVSDIRPGLVDTAMAKGEGLFWVMPVDKAARQIYTALKKKKDIVCVTKRWGVIGFLLKHMPKSLYYKL